MYGVQLIDRNGEVTTLTKHDVIVVTDTTNSGGRRFRVRVVRIDPKFPKAHSLLRWEDVDKGTSPRGPAGFFEKGLLADPMPPSYVFYSVMVQVMAAFFGRKIKMLSLKEDYDKHASALDHEPIILMAQVED